MEWCDGYVIDDVEGLVLSSFQNFFEDLCDFSKINSCGERETHPSVKIFTLIYYIDLNLRSFHIFIF